MKSTKTVYHHKDGPVEMYLVDAQHAVARFPHQWSEKPWPEDVAQASEAENAEAAEDFAAVDDADATIDDLDAGYETGGRKGRKK